MLYLEHVPPHTRQAQAEQFRREMATHITEVEKALIEHRKIAYLRTKRAVERRQLPASALAEWEYWKF